MGRAVIETISIEDPLDAAPVRAIEVTVRVVNGGPLRWCFFMTPETLATCGDMLATRPGVRVHLGVAHMIVVSRIDADVIHEVLRQLDRRGELLMHTAPAGAPEQSEEEQFLRAVQALRDSRSTHPELWQSDTIEDYFEAALAWARDSDFGARQAVGASPWAKVRAFLEAGRSCE